MDLHDYLDVARRRWRSILIVALATLALSAGATLLMTPRYTATTRVFFAVASTGTAADLAQGSSFAERQMTSYAEVARSPLVLDPVIRDLRLDVGATDLERRLTATVPTGTVILELSFTDVNASRSAAVANAVGAKVSEVASSLSPDRADGTQAVRATTLSPAAVPLAASSPKIPRNLALALVAGLLLGFGIALLRQVLDTKVRSEQDVRSATDSAILGVIAFDDKVPAHPVILRDDPQSPAAEAVRRLRTNLQFIDVSERSRSIVISSSVPGEGKTTAAINLAVSLADAGSRVLLIDADLRRPSIAEYLGLEGTVGLTTVLIGKATVADVIQPFEDSSLDILPSGQLPPNPSELLGSKAMSTLLSGVTKTYDMVLIDSPPLLPVTDAAVLGRQAGGMLIIAGVDIIHRPQLKETMKSLDTAGCQVLGVVVNKIARRDIGAYAYEQGYYGYASAVPVDEEAVSTVAVEDFAPATLDPGQRSNAPV